MLENLLPYVMGVLGIVVIDLVLSGDNALVIGMAARRLPPHRRRLAILLGGAGAIGLRLLFAAIATLLLTIPLLQAAGGVMLLWIAWKLLRERETVHQVAESVSVAGALKTILLADLVMSLDNILGVAGTSHGDLGLLLFGLLLSMPLILSGSGLIARLMDRLPWLEMVGAGVLVWTAGTMIAEDPSVSQLLPLEEEIALLLPVLLTAALAVTTLWGLLANPSNRTGWRGWLPRQLVPVVALLRRGGERRGME